MLVAALTKLGPCLSTDLADYLVKTHGLSPEAARQRVSRAPPEVKRLAHLPFARKARFLYLEKEYLSPYYWRALRQAIYGTDGPYARALGAVEARSVVPLAHFRTACGAPLAQKKHVSADTVLERLVAASVLSVIPVAGLGDCIVTRKLAESGSLSDEIAKVRARLISEGIFLNAVRGWVKNMGLASWDKVACRDEAKPPQVGTFTWDLTGPSYLAPLTAWTKAGTKSPGFVVCDILLNGTLDEQAIAAFLHKCSTGRQLRNMRPTLALFIAEHYSKRAFNALKSDGNIPATPESLFGKDVAEGFKQLTATLEAAAKGAVDPAKFNELFARLGKVEGAVGNMRGALFELLVAEVIRRTAVGTASVQLNKLCKGDDGADAEVDVWVTTPNQDVRFIECKGRQPGSVVADEEITDWLTKRIIRVRQHIQRTLDWKPTKITFELWVTGELSDAVLERIEKTRAANASKFELVIRRPEDIRSVVSTTHDQGLLKTFEQHFLPLAYGADDTKALEHAA